MDINSNCHGFAGVAAALILNLVEKSDVCRDFIRWYDALLARCVTLRIDVGDLAQGKKRYWSK